MGLADLGFALAKPFLHKMDAEQAHGLTISSLKAGLGGGRGPIKSTRLETKLFGLTFANPVGLAPGFDKNAEVPDAMLGQGFGFVEMASQEEAERAMQQLNGQSLDGRAINVSEARPQAPRENRGGGGGGRSFGGGGGRSFGGGGGRGHYSYPIERSARSSSAQPLFTLTKTSR